MRGGTPMLLGRPISEVLGAAGEFWPMADEDRIGDGDWQLVRRGKRGVMLFHIPGREPRQDL